MIPKPPVAITITTSVPTLLNYFAEERISRDELHAAFCTKVQWEHRPDSVADGEDWTSINTWRTVYDAIGNQITRDDYMFLAHAYELHQEAQLAN